MLGTGTALSTIPYCARNAQLSIGQPVIAVARLPESSALGLQFAPFATFTGGVGNEEKKKNKNKVQDQLDAAACIAAEEKREILKEGASYGSLFWLYIWFSLSLAPSPCPAKPGRYAAATVRHFVQDSIATRDRR